MYHRALVWGPDLVFSFSLFFSFFLAYKRTRLYYCILQTKFGFAVSPSDFLPIPLHKTPPPPHTLVLLLASFLLWGHMPFDSPLFSTAFPPCDLLSKFIAYALIHSHLHMCLTLPVRIHIWKRMCFLVLTFWVWVTSLNNVIHFRSIHCLARFIILFFFMASKPTLCVYTRHSAFLNIEPRAWQGRSLVSSHWLICEENSRWKDHSRQ